MALHLRMLMQAAAQQRCSPRRQPPRRQPLPRRRHRPSAARGPSDVLVLDFDGVLCDSEREVSTSGYEASQARWPHLFGGLPEGERRRVLAGMRLARPRLIKGYEALVMARLILEDNGNVQRILADWEPLLAGAVQRWGEGHDALAAAFELHRAAQLRDHPDRWLALNPLYPGVGAALQHSPYPFFVASSKAASRLVPLLRASLGEDVEPARLFASLIPPNEMKIQALRTIMGRPEAGDGATLHFVDDRFETLQAIAEQAFDLLARWRLYLADWGYNTAAERTAAAALPGVRLLALPQFCELLKGGVVPEQVDDGCEATPEEAAEAAKR